MSNVINFYFQILSAAWSIITQQWIIAVFFLLGVINLIVTIYLNSRQQ